MIRPRTFLPVLVATATVLGAGFQLSGCAFDESGGGTSAPPASYMPMVVGVDSAGIIQMSTAGITPPNVGAGGGSGEDQVHSQGPSVATANPGVVDTQCGQNSQPAGVRPVVLLFAFDASASMGQKSDQNPYYDPDKKWNPVVKASKAFFADTASAGLSATLTFFPQESPTAATTPTAAPTMAPPPAATGAAMSGAMMTTGGFQAQAGTMQAGFQQGGQQQGGTGGIGGGVDPSLCQTMTYVTPDVPVTTLPSPAFGAAMDAATPPPGADWRLGTPTQWALEGIQQQIAALKMAEQAEHPNKYVVVLVTDGAPTDCRPQGLNDLTPVTRVIKAMADAGSPTYVIGVDAVDGDPSGAQLGGNLDKFAQSGGTEKAFIVDTGDPAKTSADFKKVVDDIRNANLGCSIEIPKAPSGQNFDKEKVNVSYRDLAMMKTDLFYDPTCMAANAWHFDNETAPKAIELCSSTCGVVQQTVEAKIDLSLGCKRVSPPAT